ncbi:MAG: T9SS type A sorting domain-containing protein [Bacteroidota bacterium]
MKRYFILFPAIFICSLSFSQNFYVVSQRDVPLINKTFMLNVNNCDSFPIFTCPPTNNVNQLPENQYTDMSINYTTMYFVSGWGSLYSRNLNDSISCQYLGNFNYNINALATANTGVIYAAGQVNGVCKLFKYQGGAFSLLGNFPSNFFSAGDLFFYDNRLFMTGTTGDLSSGYIIEVDVNNPSLSCYYMPLPNMHPWGAFSINTGNISRVFIISTHDNSGVHTSSLYEINMGNKTIGSLMCTYPYFINGAATVYSYGTAGNTLCDPTAINNLQSDYIFRIANPVTNSIHIETNLDPSQIQSLALFNASGELLESFNHENYTPVVDVSHLSPGIYVIRLNTINGRQYQQKLIKAD